MKNFLLTFLFFAGFSSVLIAQDRQVQGIVFDSSTKERLNRVYIYNTRTDKGIYNNTKGEYTIPARKGDTLIVALQGYRVDTTTVQSENIILFYLTKTSIMLREVVITDTVMSPEKRLEEVQKAYKNIYRIGDSRVVNSYGEISIDGIYSLLSREGKNARHLQDIIERDYHDAIIDYRYTKNLVNSITNLQGEKLTDFMSQYRPNYRFVLEANDYSFVSFIRANYTRYVQNPSAYRLPSLK